MVVARSTSWWCAPDPACGFERRPALQHPGSTSGHGESGQKPVEGDQPASASEVVIAARTIV